MARAECAGQHRIHVVETVVNPAEGKAIVLALCLNCGEGFTNTHQIAKPGSEITRSEKEKA